MYVQTTHKPTTHTFNYTRGEKDGLQNFQTQADNRETTVIRVRKCHIPRNSSYWHWPQPSEPLEGERRVTPNTLWIQ